VVTLSATAMLQIFSAIGSSLTLLALAWHDLRQRRLPNALVLTVAVFYLLAALLTPKILLAHLAVGLLGLLIGMLLTAARVMGGGDAKLLAAILCWAGPSEWWVALVVTTQIGLLVALLGLAARWGLRYHPARWLSTPLRLFTVARGVPYGVALAAGGLMVIARQF